MKFTHLSLATAFATVAFAEKYSFFAELNSGKTVPIASDPKGDNYQLTYDLNKKEEPVVFDKDVHTYSTTNSNGERLTLGMDGDGLVPPYAYGKDVKRYLFRTAKDGLITNAEAYACAETQDSSKFWITQGKPRKGKKCERLELYAKVVSDDNIFSFPPAAASSSIEASSIPSSEPDLDCTEAFRDYDLVNRRKCIYERAIEAGRKNPLYAEEWHDLIGPCDDFKNILDKYPQQCLVKYAEKLDEKFPPPAEEHELLKDKECGEINYYFKDGSGNCLKDYVNYLNTRRESDRFDVGNQGPCPQIINIYKKLPDKCARLLVEYTKKN